MFPATQATVIVDSNAPSDRALSVRVVISSEGRSTGQTLAFVRGGSTGTVAFPASFGATPGEGPNDARVTLTLDASLAGASGSPPLVFQRVARFRFIPRTNGVVRLFLNTACGAPAIGCRSTPSTECTVSALCTEAGATCGDLGECVAVDTPLEPVQGDAALGVDAPAVDARFDAQSFGDASDIPDVRDVPTDTALDSSLDARDAAFDAFDAGLDVRDASIDARDATDATGLMDIREVAPDVARDTGMDVVDSAVDAGTWGPFGPAVPLTRVNSTSDDFSPSIVQGNVLYFCSTRASGSSIYVSRLVAATWSTPIAVTIDGITTACDPDVSADGTTMRFITVGPGFGVAYEATRVGTAIDHFTPRDSGASTGCVLGSCFADAAEGPSQSADGLRLFYSDTFSSTLRLATRATMSGHFNGSAVVDVMSPTMTLPGHPSIAMDDLSLFFDTGDFSTRDLAFVTRATPAGAWSGRTVLTALNTTSSDRQPSISGDGTTLAFASNRPGGTGGFDIYLATRTRR